MGVADRQTYEAETYLVSSPIESNKLVDRGFTICNLIFKVTVVILPSAT
jgi:hypothetical protein